MQAFAWQPQNDAAYRQGQKRRMGVLLFSLSISFFAVYFKQGILKKAK